MSEAHPSYPLLDRLYLRFLEDENSADFIAAVSANYLISTLCRLAECGRRVTRRGAVLALGFLADYDANTVLGRRLRDEDHGVRMLAENAIREIWYRDGNERQRHELAIISRWSNSLRFDDVLDRATALIEDAPHFAEAWNQRAIAFYQLGRYEEAANDCHQALELNAYHFGAAVGLAHCYLEMGEGLAALDCFRRAVDINPSLEAVREQISYLQRAFEGR